MNAFALEICVKIDAKFAGGAGVSKAHKIPGTHAHPTNCCSHWPVMRVIFSPRCVTSRQTLKKVCTVLVFVCLGLCVCVLCVCVVFFSIYLSCPLDL